MTSQPAILYALQDLARDFESVSVRCQEIVDAGPMDEVYQYVHEMMDYASHGLECVEEVANRYGISMNVVMEVVSDDEMEGH